ncbi:MAG TPA: hypothetical protein VGG28_12695, partial [Kofleriaceae bacterium]
MPVTAPRVSPFPSRSPAKQRVARVAAKRPRRRNEKSDERRNDDEDEAVEVPESASRPDSGTYLSMYFRDMALLDVLRPEEEFTSAREIETLEIMLWEAVLSHAPLIARLLDAIETVPDYTASTEVKTLRKLAGGRDVKALARQAARVARKLRASDTDHLFIDAVLVAIDHVALGIGVRGDESGSVGRAKIFAEWLRRVHSANRAANDARNDFVKANLRLVVSIARRFNHGRMALADLIQEG